MIADIFQTIMRPARSRKLLMLVVPFIGLIFIAREIAPIITPNDAIAIALDTTSNRIAGVRRELENRIQRSGQIESRVVSSNVTSLVAVRIPITVLAGGKDFEYLEGRPTVAIRWDNLIVFSGLILVLIMAGPLLSSAFVMSLDERPTRANTSPDGISPNAIESFGDNAETMLEAEVRTAQERAEQLYSRSTFLLVAGIILAFVGVGIFYVSLPSPEEFADSRASFVSFGAVSLQNSPPESSSGGDLLNPSPPPITTPPFDIWKYLTFSIRPAGALIFIEAIAWFLLRQYRALIEDYKVFHRMYLKRANYLIAYRTLGKKISLENQLLLVGALLEEDLTGKLRAGETSEALESMKASDTNPVFSLVNRLIDNLPKASGKGQ